MLEVAPAVLEVAPRLCWKEPRVPTPAWPTTLRRSQRRTVRRVPPKWGVASWTCRVRLGWSCGFPCRTCLICCTCGLSWTGGRAAARRAASLTGRGFLSRSSPSSYLHGGRVGWVPPAGRGGWRCGRRRRREGGPGAALRTTGAPSRPAAARGAPPVASSRPAFWPPGVASPPPVVACPRSCAQVHLCQVRHDETNEGGRQCKNNP